MSTNWGSLLSEPAYASKAASEAHARVCASEMFEWAKPGIPISTRKMVSAYRTVARSVGLQELENYAWNRIVAAVGFTPMSGTPGGRRQFWVKPNS